jgi:hypothetical protein
MVTGPGAGAGAAAMYAAANGSMLGYNPVTATPMGAGAASAGAAAKISEDNIQKAQRDFPTLPIMLIKKILEQRGLVEGRKELGRRAKLGGGKRRSKKRSYHKRRQSRKQRKTRNRK